MEMICISAPESRRGFGIAALIIGILILLFSPLVVSLIGIFISAAVLVISILIIIFGLILRGTGLSLPLIIFGLIGCTLGSVAILSPETVVSVLGILLGIWMIILGVGQLVLGSSFMDWWYRIITIIAGILTAFIGLYLIIEPVSGINIMVLFLGFYLASYGILGIIRPKNPNQQYYCG